MFVFPLFVLVLFSCTVVYVGCACSWGVGVLGWVVIVVVGVSRIIVNRVVGVVVWILRSICGSESRVK